VKVLVDGWGNSVALRIPTHIASRMGLCAGAPVEVEAEGDRIVVTPTRRRYVLTDLLKGMTPEVMRETFDWGPDKGRKVLPARRSLPLSP